MMFLNIWIEEIEEIFKTHLKHGGQNTDPQSRDNPWRLPCRMSTIERAWSNSQTYIAQALLIFPSLQPLGGILTGLPELCIAFQQFMHYFLANYALKIPNYAQFMWIAWHF